MILKKIKFDINTTIIWVSLINIVLAVIALLKDIMSAAYLGTSKEADALYLAFFIPDTLGNCLLSSAIGVACVPVFSILIAKKNVELLTNLIKKILLVIIFISIGLYITVYITRSNLLNIINPNLSTTDFRIVLAILDTLLPSIVIFPLIGVCVSILYSTSYFKSASMIPIIFNAIFLIGLIAEISSKSPIDVGINRLAYIILIAVIGMLAFAMIPAYISIKKLLLANSNPQMTRGIEYTNINKIESRRLFSEIMCILFPYIGILVCTYLIQFAERYFASRLGAGSIAGLNYTFRLVQFPIWVFVAAIGNVILPKLSQLKGHNENEGFKAQIEKTLILTLIITIPISIGILILREPILWILLKRGAFNMSSLTITSNLLKGYSFAIVGLGISAISLKYFLALGKLKMPFFVFFVYSIFNIGIDYFLVNHMGLAGIGVGAAIASLLSSLCILALLKKYIGLQFKKLFIRIIYVIIANIPVAILMLFFQKIWYNLRVYTDIYYIMTYVLSVCVLFAVVYWTSIRILKLDK